MEHPFWADFRSNWLSFTYECDVLGQLSNDLWIRCGLSVRCLIYALLLKSKSFIRRRSNQRCTIKCSLVTRAVMWSNYFTQHPQHSLVPLESHNQRIRCSIIGQPGVCFLTLNFFCCYEARARCHSQIFCCRELRLTASHFQVSTN